MTIVMPMPPFRLGLPPGWSASGDVGVRQCSDGSKLGTLGEGAHTACSLVWERTYGMLTAIATTVITTAMAVP